jgi:hypothetical protein
MKLGEDLVKRLRKKFEPSSMVTMRYKGNDIAFKTDKEGNPIQLFVGTKNDEGIIKGYRYIRTLLEDRNGTIIKDHWDLKGKSS